MNENFLWDTSSRRKYMQKIVKLDLHVDELYLKKAKRGTRVKLPMYDGYTIKKFNLYLFRGGGKTALIPNCFSTGQLFLRKRLIYR